VQSYFVPAVHFATAAQNPARWDRCDGAVTGSALVVAGNVALYTGTSGKTIGDSGNVAAARVAAHWQLSATGSPFRLARL
jgi:hypothetical protein